MTPLPVSHVPEDLDRRTKNAAKLFGIICSIARFLSLADDEPATND
jgi:hypothetical protein